MTFFSPCVNTLKKSPMRCGPSLPFTTFRIGDSLLAKRPAWRGPWAAALAKAPGPMKFYAFSQPIRLIRLRFAIGLLIVTLAAPLKVPAPKIGAQRSGLAGEFFCRLFLSLRRALRRRRGLVVWCHDFAATASTSTCQAGDANAATTTSVEAAA